MNRNIISKIIITVCLFLLSQAFGAQTTKAAGTAKAKLNAAIVSKMGFAGVSFKKQDAASWLLKNGITVYSSVPYAQKVRGFMGPTPLFVAVDNQRKIVAVVADRNGESPEFFNLTKNLLKAWNGKTLPEAEKFTPDVVTGATLSSRAVIQTVHATVAGLSKN